MLTNLPLGPIGPCAPTLPSSPFVPIGPRSPYMHLVLIFITNYIRIDFCYIIDKL